MLKREPLEYVRSELLLALEEQHGINAAYKPGDPWHSPLWDAVRTMKGILRNAKLDGESAWKLMRALAPMNTFLEAATPHSDSPGDEDEVHVEWVRAWNGIRMLPGENLLESALRRADAGPVLDPGEHGSQKYCRFLALCKALATNAEDNVIAIPQTRWGTLLGVRQKTISAWIGWAITDRAVVIVEKHSLKRKRSARYLVDVGKLVSPPPK